MYRAAVKGGKSGPIVIHYLNISGERGYSLHGPIVIQYLIISGEKKEELHP